MILTRPELLQKLSEENFAQNYYQLYEQLKEKPKMTEVTKDFVSEVLKTTGLEWKFLPQDKIFTYRKEIPNGNIGINLDYRYSKIEATLVYKISREEIGDTFPLLALQVARLKDPNFSYAPPYPKLPYSNAEDLHDILTFTLKTLTSLSK